MAAASSDPAALLASLQIQSHPLLAQQLESAQRLIAERRYAQAEEQVKGWMKDMQKEIKDAASAPAGSTSAPALPTLSQIMTTFLPFLRTVAQLRKENESAEFDVQTMVDEVNKYKAAMAAAQAAKGDAHAPKPVRAPHADYVHPHLRLANLAERGRGVVATVPRLPDGCAAPASSSAPSADPAGAHSSGARIVIPKNTTLLVSKALGFVTAPALPLGVDTPAAEQDAHEEKMANALVTLLALKLGQEASLIPEIYALDAGERYAEDRERRLSVQRSPLEFGRPIPAIASPSLVHAEGEAAEARTDDLEIDLARLALIVARNAFAPPQIPERESERREHDSDALQQQGQAMQSSGLWLTCSLLNHACRPNAHWFCVGDVMFVRSLRDIRADEEVTISYTGFDAKLYAARQQRCHGWGFPCACRDWCEPFVAHPQLVAIETEFVAGVDRLDPKIHALVDAVHEEEEGTHAHRKAMTDLRNTQAELIKLVDQFKSRLMNQCGKAPGTAAAAAAPIGGNVACIGKGPKEYDESAQPQQLTLGEDALVDVEREEEEAEAAEAAASADPAKSSKAKSKGKKKKSSSAAAAAGASSTAAGASSSTLASASASSHASLASLPQHTRCLLVHLSQALSLLGLCSVSLPYAATASLKAYRQALVAHEKCMLTAIHLLGDQYGPGDETVVFAWLEVLNTWMQFAAGGVEYRRPEEMKAVFELIVHQHCDHFGAKPAHFKATWMPLIQQMGLEEMVAF